MHQNAEAVSHDAYVNGWGPPYQEPDVSEIKIENLKMVKQLDAERISSNVGPWVNWLLKPPGISQGVPWLEHNRTEGKPYLVYETQIQQPAKYRADFPLRLVALASIQDWDWISWHYFASGDDVGLVERPFDKPMDITTGKHPQGYHYTYDEVQNSTMRAAAFMFRHELLNKAPNPTKFIYGRKSLYAPESMVYAGSYGVKGMDMFQTTYQYGVRIEIDPSREEDEVIGPVVSFADRKTHNPYTPTDEIVFDWKKGYLKMDAPGAVSFTGLLANYGKEVSFKNGVVLKDVSFNNPEGIFSPMDEKEGYMAFALNTDDGKSLAETKKASVSLVSTSFNTGFDAPRDTFFKDNKVIEGTIKAGGLPVLTVRVGGTIQSAALKGMNYKFRDWHFQEIGSGKIEGDQLVIPNDKPIFFVELTR
ncbi:MAG: hypothetical protein HC904_13990 [Blastochloris sp.]|nr:hypothetical protein [Blastochloris sp.]